ncbi:MAG TPA: hypothetical protein VFC63_24405 [Blastocatellia bacterium]|nr:hypothetical protein [Blastocatellia bacterium]
MRVKSIIILCLLSTFVLCVGTQASSSDTNKSLNSSDGAKETFSALADLPVSEQTRNVTIIINDYSTDQDLQRLQNILTDSGPDALLKTLGKMKSLGRIERVGTVSFYDFRIIISKPTAEGRQIYAVADRPMKFWEEYYDTQSTEYPFGVMELNLKKGKDGKEEGTGSLVYAAKIKGLTGDKFKLENYTFAPIQLLGVRQLGSSRH